MQIAKTLLTNALNARYEAAIVVEIEQRLKDMQPKPTPKANCLYCGDVFEAKVNDRNRQRIRQACKDKNIHIILRYVKTIFGVLVYCKFCYCMVGKVICYLLSSIR